MRHESLLPSLAELAHGDLLRLPTGLPAWGRRLRLRKERPEESRVSPEKPDQLALVGFNGAFEVPELAFGLDAALAARPRGSSARWRDTRSALGAAL